MDAKCVHSSVYAFKSERKSTKKMHPCVKADTFDYTFCIQEIISEMALCLGL